jgi:hypothetical protein
MVSLVQDNIGYNIESFYLAWFSRKSGIQQMLSNQRNRVTVYPVRCSSTLSSAVPLVDSVDGTSQESDCASPS